MNAGGRTGLYERYVVALLLLIFILSYFDRFIITLLVEPIKQTMKLSDFEIGLLLGPAFSLFHVLVSIPLGWYADRSNRKYLLMAGIVIWCTMTAGGGFVTTFVPLFLLRLGLGLGEAVVSPCSLSIISDYFDRKERARAISVYMAGPYLGAGFAFLLGGLIVGWLTEHGPITILGMGPFQPWQATFVLVGLPGLIAALALTTVREPQRQEMTRRDGDAPATGATRYMLKRWPAFAVLFLGSTCNYALSTLTFWNVPLFARLWGWDVPTIGAVTGMLYFTAGPLATLLAVWATKKMNERYPADGTLRVLLMGLMIGVPASALYPIMPTPQLAVAIMFVAFIGKAVGTAAGPASLAMIVPGDLRGRSIAVFNTVVALIGPLIGPPLIGWGVDATGDPKSIGIVLSGFVLCVGIPSLLVLGFGLRHYRKVLTEVEERFAPPGTALQPA